MSCNQVRSFQLQISKWALFLILELLILGSVSFAQEEGGGGQGGGNRGAAAGPPANPLLPPERELAMKVKGNFTFAGVGDMILRVPLGNWQETNFQSLIKHLRDADVAFANMEGPLVDLDSFNHSLNGGAPRQALLDLKNFGIDIMSTANNHSMDGGEAGLFETIKNLNEGGIVYAGTGRNLQEARAAHFYNSNKGIVGLVSTFSVDADSNPSYSAESGATYRNGDRGGLSGVNGLHLTAQYIVTQAQMDELRKIRDAVYSRRSEVFAPIAPAAANEPKDKLELFGRSYIVGPKAGDVHYEMNQNDLREIAKSVRNAKQSSDFVVATIHCHQGNYSFQTYTYDNDTPDFLVEFAHKLIDAGADVFIGHGVHTIRGVEIYKGKPIFYGVNTYIYQYQSSSPANPGGALTDAETTMAPGGFAGERAVMKERFESLLTEARYQDGQLSEVRVYPADLGQDGKRPFSRLGVPMTPSPQMAQQVLEKLQRLSRPFGTNIAIENGVGVIRITPTKSVSQDRGGK